MYGPISRLHIKGVVWYQGESDTWQPQLYGELLKALIADWRGMWGDVPVILEQLHNFMEPTSGPSDSGWAQMRETQRKALAVPGTAMAVAIDLGEWNDIHPQNKKDVGDRIALAALKLAYGRDIVASGPLYRAMRVECGKAILSFDSIGNGLAAKDGPELRQFTIAGADGIYRSAKAEIRSGEVVVWSDEVPQPAHVRYAWASNPQGANLYNAEGLPASPFQADAP
jgi:sialate O-acetylesterase